MPGHQATPTRRGPLGACGRGAGFVLVTLRANSQERRLPIRRGRGGAFECPMCEHSEDVVANIK